MECREAESLVQQYIDDKLPPKKQEAFITHVQNCSACYEELETYYIIHHAIKYLDEDRYDSYNMKEMLSEDLKKKEKRLRTNHRIKTGFLFAGGILAIIILVYVIFLLIPIEFVPEILIDVIR